MSLITTVRGGVGDGSWPLTADTRLFVAGRSTMIGAALVRWFEVHGFRALVGIDGEPELTDAGAVDRFFAEMRPEYVIVAAGRAAGIGGNQRYPADLMLDNLQVAAHVIPAAWRHGTTKLLYLASSCAYPKHAPQPLNVDALWTGPLEPTSAAYAVAKLAGLKLCEVYRQQYGARFISAIKADAFGPGDDFTVANSHVVGALMRRMHEARLTGARTVDIWGTGSPRREFIYVDDLADAAVFLTHTYEGPQPINIGTGVSTSVRQLAEILREVVGFTGDLVFDASRPDGMPVKALDSGPLRALGWAPAWELRAALARTYEWFMAHPEACDDAERHRHGR